MSTADGSRPEDARRLHALALGVRVDRERHEVQELRSALAQAIEELRGTSRVVLSIADQLSQAPLAERPR